MPKRDRRSKVHKKELIDRMLVKENIDLPEQNLTIEDMSEARINDRVQKFAKERDEDGLTKKLRDEQS